MNEAQAKKTELRIAMFVFPGMTLLDMAGPQTIWGIHGKSFLVAREPGLITTDTGVPVMATHGFDDCPTNVDILCVPGGLGTWDVLLDDNALAFLRRVGAQARFVTSVCTGSIILAAAGLLQGYKATTHWANQAVLESLGVEVVAQRVCVDGNRITGGGVTAGIDFGFAVLAELLGEQTARMTQLLFEYDPAPPFDAGSPARAGAELTATVMAMLQDDIQHKAMPAVRSALERAR